MLDFPRWKRWAIVLSLVVGVLLSIPSLIGETNANKLHVGFLPRINLGLDLSGGSHLLLEADTNDVVKTRLGAMEDSIRSAMRRSDPRIDIGDISTANGQLTFFVRDVSQVDAAVNEARKLTTGIGTTGQRDWDVAVIDSNRVVMKPTAAGLDSFVKEAMSGAVDVVRNRIDALGTREPTIALEGADRILVEVPGVQDPKGLKDLIGKTAKLEFKLVDLNVGQAQLIQNQAPIGTEILHYENGAPIAVQRRAIISGTQLTDAKLSYDQNGLPAVSINFDTEGARRFGRVTQQNVGRPFAIIVDNVVLSAPVINEPILSGNAQISGGSFTVDSANALAIALKSGALPVALKVVEERTVLAQLGADSIRAGITASVIAVVAIVLFMLVTYGRFGVYANIAVILNVFVILAIMALFHGTLTLPGIAGFVLTIGTAVDANVLINERIREERRRGRNVVQAVELGYKEASRTIFEANATHAISGFVMLIMGSGPVKGFAIVLLIGIATSVYTAVLFTRMMVAGYLRRHRPATITI
jgi:preprotein translocase subunit SecD